jgi:hypothetical protein
MVGLLEEGMHQITAILSQRRQAQPNKTLNPEKV